MHILETKGLNKTFSNGQGTQQPVLKRSTCRFHRGVHSSDGTFRLRQINIDVYIKWYGYNDCGQCPFKGQEISALSETELAALRLHSMGFIFQQMHLLKNLNIRDNIILSAYRAKRPAAEPSMQELPIL